MHFSKLYTKLHYLNSYKTLFLKEKLKIGNHKVITFYSDLNSENYKLDKLYTIEIGNCVYLSKLYKIVYNLKNIKDLFDKKI